MNGAEEPAHPDSLYGGIWLASGQWQEWHLSQELKREQDY